MPSSSHAIQGAAVELFGVDFHTNAAAGDPVEDEQHGIRFAGTIVGNPD